MLRAGQAAQAWRPCDPPGEGRGDRLSTAALFLAAAVWRRAGNTPALALPLWSAMPRHLERLALAAGPDWLGGFLTTATDATQRAGQELTRLQIAAERLRLSPQAAPGLINQLVAAGVLREATGRAAWRAFVVA